jgi:hypothetical protein
MNDGPIWLAQPATGLEALASPRFSHLLTLARVLFRLRLQVLKSSAINWHKIGT